MADGARLPRYYWVRYPDSRECFIVERVEGCWYYDGQMLSTLELEVVEGPLAVPEARRVPKEAGS